MSFSAHPISITLLDKDIIDRFRERCKNLAKEDLIRCKGKDNKYYFSLNYYGIKNFTSIVATEQDLIDLNIRFRHYNDLYTNIKK